MKREILILGNEKLYKVCDLFAKDDLEDAKRIAGDLEDTLDAFRAEKGFGRAIAAPQIGESVRMIFMKLGEVATVFVNPCMEVLDDETFELWDDCMSFPGLEVKVARYRKVCVTYRDLDWQIQTQIFEGDLSELFQHEFDHLNGVLAVQRAVDEYAYRMNQ